jgi:hypothetical protein|tara:strand:+ start:414 stop:659 length:246 start_codon:yes stop_codon:yes gene_type:complete
MLFFNFRTAVKSFFEYGFRSNKACLLASGSGYKPSKELLDKYKIKNPNELWGAIHKESRSHYLQGKLNPMILVPKNKVVKL